MNQSKGPCRLDRPLRIDYNLFLIERLTSLLYGGVSRNMDGISHRVEATSWWSLGGKTGSTWN
jgi:hypothetical protein